MQIKLSIKGAYNVLHRFYRWIIATILLVLVIISALVFYQNVYLVVEGEQDFNENIRTVNEEILNNVLTNIDEREENFFRVSKKKYPDIFTP